MQASDWSACVDHVFQNDEYTLIASVEEDVVVAYVHDTEIYRNKPTQRLRKLTEFFDYYGSERPLTFIVDNGFGYLYKSNDNVSVV